MQTGPTVPQLVLNKPGETYGGQYWNQTEYQITLDAPAHGSVTGTFNLTVETTLGTAVCETTITHEQAAGLRVAIHGHHDTHPVPGLDGLHKPLVWNLCNDASDHVELTQNDLTEVADWLEYALGHQQWDWENSDEWVY